ncbi:hypothetical protein EBB59_00900 [Lysobacter pythonis]|uniref:Toxin CptA n=1 Tax=Solilutibacter pythonis TaxID=2483112 RepID=A0A3M2I9B0_9GAMM|nr:hypothetical protein [Lysobacter pythonis]RMH94884.1 hypothetical protein EBB59_00900 [Lysobacter pythonis]
MSKSHRLYNASATCRLEWRPSRVIAGWWLALAVLAPLSSIASGLPRPAAWALAMVACLLALRGWRAFRSQPRRQLVVRVEGPLSVDGANFHDWRLQWRGPLAFIQWRDGAGRLAALSFWPDTLPPGTRRELRLASPLNAAVSTAVGMAT